MLPMEHLSVMLQHDVPEGPMVELEPREGLADRQRPMGVAHKGYSVGRDDRICSWGKSCLSNWKRWTGLHNAQMIPYLVAAK